MFSRRTRWNLTENRVAEAARGRALIDLTQSNPTTAGLEAPGILALLADPAAATYAPEPFGLPSAREAAARAWGADPSRIVLSASTSEAYGWLFKLLCDPGDRVLVPRPSYPLLDFLAGLEAVALDPYPTHLHDDWRIDLDALERAITDRTRAVVIVSPNNPTGAVLRHDELRTLSRICLSRGLALVVDEVFADWIDHAPPDLARTATHAGCLTFTMSGLSKVALLPQLKLAWTSVSGPDLLVREALARLEVIADSYLSVATPVQVALPAILDRCEALQAPLRARLRSNERALLATMRDTALSVLPRAGGWSSVVRLPRSRTEEEWVLAAIDAGVLVHPGHYFDFEQEAFAVVSLLVEERAFAEGVRRLATLD